MNRKLLASAICAALVLPAFANVAFAQETDATDKTEATDLDKVVVTGSLIPRSQLETASPVITITGEQIEKQGFKNVYDALRSSSLSTGSVQDSQFTNSFTPAANTVSLLGLDPSFSLVLLNGRPMADYPLLYNSNSNFVDLGTIPSFLVERIDILPGNQSAIYGSAAIAGVVNIVLKKELNGYSANLRTGTYTDGGGNSARFQFAGGNTIGKLQLLYGLELSKQDPIYGFDRSYTDSAADNPTVPGAPVARRDVLTVDAFTGRYIDPGQGTCDAMSNLFGGDLAYRQRTPQGFYCGTNKGVGYTTFMNNREDANGYLGASYAVNDNVELYASALYNVDTVRYLVGGTAFWYNTSQYGAPDYLYDLDSGHLVSTAQRIFAPEETGQYGDGRVVSHSYVADIGVRGTFGDSNWAYDGYYHRSEYRTKATSRRSLSEKVNAFFLGEQDGTDPYGYGYPAYHLRSGGIFRTFTPEEYLGFTDTVASRSRTYSQNVNLTVTNTDLFSLPAGAVGFAGLIEVGDQLWDNPIDPRVTAGEFWGTGGTSGYGKRDRQAIGGEINLPLFSMLTANASARYDRYNADGNSDSKVTYKLGLEFRPVESLLFRGNYATAFRAPDMGYIFSTGSNFFTTATDYYDCRQAGSHDYAQCANVDDVQIQGSQTGNSELNYITAKSYGFGVVWSPTNNFTIKADYYNVKIADEVNSYSIDTILRNESDCRLGVDSSGNAVDINSAECQQFIGQVHRTPFNAPLNPGELRSVDTYPINVSDETVTGITANLEYTLDTDRWGEFSFGADYNTTLKHTYKAFPTDDDSYDYLRAKDYYAQFKDIGSGTIGWTKGNWSATVRGTRYGRTWNYAGTEKVSPWMTYNASVQYDYDDMLTISLIGNNVLNTRPPTDKTYSAYPYYNVFNYNSFGRLLMLQVAVRFGGDK